MKKFISFLIMAASLLVISCKKETINVPEPTPVKKHLVKTTLNEHRDFIYNPDGTVKDIIIDNLGYEYKETYTYGPNKIDYILIRDGKKIEDGGYTLANGKATTYTWTGYDVNGAVTGTYQYFYSYNGKGLLTKKQYDNGEYYLYSYDANDNLVQLVEYDDHGIPIVKEEYTYSNQKDLFPQYSFLNSFNSGFFLPAFAKYLPVSFKHTYLPTNEVGTGTISYELDADGYVVKGKYDQLTGVGGSFDWVSTFQ